MRRSFRGTPGGTDSLDSIPCRLQVENCEWHVTRDPSSGAILPRLGATAGLPQAHKYSPSCLVPTMSYKLGLPLFRRKHRICPEKRA